MYFEDIFDCSACGYDFEHESFREECQKCHETFCDECVNSAGKCVPCTE